MPSRLSRMLRALSPALVALLVVGGAAAAQAASGSFPRAADGQANNQELTFGIRPASAKAPDDRTTLSWGVTPGATVDDHVAVVNYGTKPARVSVYATDAINTDTGGFGLLPTAAKAKDAGSWITIQGIKGAITVPPSSKSGPGTVILPVSVSVPAKASPGDHSAGILAVVTTADTSNGGPAVKLEQRVGTRVFVAVAGDLKPSLAVTDLSVSYSGSLNPLSRGTATVSYTVRNTGNVNLSVSGEVSASGVFASSSAKTPELALLLPDNSVTQTVEVPGVLPQFLMSATVRLSPSVVTATEAPPVAATESSVSFWAIPWILVAVVLLALALGTWWWWRRRHPRERAGRRAKPRSGPSGRRRAGGPTQPGHDSPQEVLSP